MAKTTTTTTVNTSTWNLPESTTSVINPTTTTTTTRGEWGEGNLDSDQRRVTTTTTTRGTVTTVSTSTSESKVSTSYAYKTTGASYSTAVAGEEIVETTKSAMELIAQPYMKAGQIVNLTGKDFPADTEIQLYFDDILISPVSANTTYVGNYCKNADDTFTIKYGGGEFIYKSGPLPDSVPTNISKITRTPWFRNLIDNESNENLKYIYMKNNDIDPTTGNAYSDPYSSSKTFLISDGNGYFVASIEIPENIPTGKHTITASAIVNTVSGEYGTASATITGTSYIRHWDNVIYKRQIDIVTESVYRDVTRTDTYQKYATVNTVTENNAIIDTKTTTRIDERNDGGGGGGGGGDPVSQTFYIDTDQYLTGINLYFSNLPSTYMTDSTRPWISIREVIDGQPASQMIYVQEISKDVLKFADIGGVASTPTHIDFDYPIYVSGDKTYAFTLGCNKNEYQIYYSELGKRDLTTDTAILYQNQQNEKGVMMTSSNNNSWSAVQEADIKYTLFKSKFDTSRPRTIYITDIATDLSKFSSINVSMAYNIVQNTGINFYYAIVLDNPSEESEEVLESYNWHSFPLEELITIGDVDTYKDDDVKMHLKLKIELWTEDENVTPTINLDTLEIFLATFNKTGTYVQNIIPLN